ncbi:PAS domain-containing protein [Deinococcus kurensis]|uniref:PAS domain-containing protein n=1 Tax=Deinococcus kurensis TaxID=2662757 RepID=UPI002367DA02|nr:PAS domain-containing protein [Deinococcus kurensis]
MPPRPDVHHRVNAAAERLLGRSRAELIGRLHWDAFPASLGAPVGRALRRAGTGVEHHLTHHGTGERDILHLDAYPTAGGGVALFWRDDVGPVQAARRQDEQRYRALFNGMDEAFAVVEVIADAAGQWTDFVFLEVNAAFQRHTGLPDPVGRTATDLLGTPNPRWAALYGQAIDTGEAVRVEETEATLGRTFSLNIFPLGGRTTRQVAVLFTDVTEQTRAAAHLRESEERQVFLLALSDRLRSRTEPASLQGAVAELTLAQFGADHCLFCEVRGQQAVIQGEARRPDVPSVTGMYALTSVPDLWGTLEAGQPVIVGDIGAAPWLDKGFRTWCRSVRIASFLVIPEVHAGQVMGLFGVAQRAPRHWTEADVALAAEVAERTRVAAERACARQALEASERRLQALIEQLPGGAVFVVDQDLRYLLAHGEALTAAGFTPDQLMGRTVAQILPPEQAGEPEARYRVALAGQGFEHEHAAHGRTFLTRGAPLRDASGRVTGALALSYDITDRQQAEEAVRLLNATLEERIEDRTRRLADLNSELRALVTRTARNLEAPVQALSRLLEPAPGDTPLLEVTPWAPAALQDELLKLRGVTQDLQVLARLEERDLIRELLPLTELFHDLQAALATRGVRWFTSRLPIVRADRALLRQALSVLQTFLLSPARCPRRGCRQSGGAG